MSHATIWWECKRKVPFTFSKANKEAAKQNLHLHRGQKPFAVYACKHGQHWHIGHDNTVTVKPHEFAL